MKYIKTREDIILENIINESVIYFAPSLIYALNKIKQTPASNWGIRGFIKGNGSDEKVVSDPNDPDKKTVLKGEYIKRETVLEFIDKMINLNYKDTGGSVIYADFKLDNSSGKNKVNINFIPDSAFDSYVKSGKMDKYGLDLDILTNEPSPKIGNQIANKLSTIYDNMKLNFVGKLGKFLTSLPIKDKSNNSYSPAVIEEVSKKIALYIINGKLAEVDESLYEMKEVKGDIINKYYSKENIIDKTFSDHEDSLNQSCMIGEECNGFFDIYIYNPDQVSLLVYVQKETDKLLGRAIIWTNSNGERRMDLKYCTNSHVKSLFTKYENEHCGADFKEIKLDEIQFKRYPYLDTFYYADFNRKLLSTVPGHSFVSIRTKNGILGSHEAAGTIYQTIPDDMDPNDFIKSVFYKGYIPADEAVYVNEIASYVYLDDTVELYNDESGEAGERIMKRKAIKTYNYGRWFRIGDERLVQLSEEYYETEDNPDKLSYEEEEETIEDHNGFYILTDDATLYLYNMTYDGSLNLELSVCHTDDDDDVRMETYTDMILANTSEQDLYYDEDKYPELSHGDIGGVRKSILVDGEFPFEKFLEEIKIYDVDGTPYCSFFLNDTKGLEEYKGKHGLLKQILFLSKHGSINGIDDMEIERLYKEDYDADYYLFTIMLYGISTRDDEMYERIMIGTDYQV